MDTILSIGVRTDPESLKKWIRALNVTEVQVERQASEVPRLMGFDYMHLLIKNITEQNHMSGYKKYHPRYSRWKEGESMGGVMSFWNLYGDLLNSIRHMKAVGAGDSELGDSPIRGNAWFVGVPAGVKDSGGKSWVGPYGGGNTGKPKEIAWYGRIMEEGGTFGTQTHPARPIFEPTTEEYISNGAAMNRCERGLMFVAACWR